MRLRFILRRFVLMMISLWVVITLIFFLFRLMPGDPSRILIGPGFDEEQIAVIAARHGLDQPLHVQYLIFLRNLILYQDLGTSFANAVPVAPFVFDRVLNTVAVTVTALFAAFTIGPIIGAIFAWNRGGTVDTYGTGVVLSTWAAPMFWMGMLMLMVFSFYLGWFPTGGMRSLDVFERGYIMRFLSVDFLAHATLPFIVYFLARLSQPALYMRNSMIEVKDAEFIQLKRAEGIPERQIQIKHAARNAMLPVLHYGALAFGLAFGGSIILEVVFSWPGIGLAMWNAVLNQDYPVAQAAFFVIAGMVMFFNFIVDIISVYVDPRVAEGGGIS